MTDLAPRHQRGKRLCPHGSQRVVCSECKRAYYLANREARKTYSAARRGTLGAGTYTPVKVKTTRFEVRPCCQDRHCHVCAGTDHRVEIVRRS